MEGGGGGDDEPAEAEDARLIGDEGSEESDEDDDGDEGEFPPRFGMPIATMSEMGFFFLAPAGGEVIRDAIWPNYTLGREMIQGCRFLARLRLRIGSRWRSRRRWSRRWNIKSLGSRIGGFDGCVGGVEGCLLFRGESPGGGFEGVD